MDSSFTVSENVNWYSHCGKWYRGFSKKLNMTQKTQKFHSCQTNKKHLHDPDNHDGMITHLETDILECEVK